jgi:hypothetical protein
MGMTLIKDVATGETRLLQTTDLAGGGGGGSGGAGGDVQPLSTQLTNSTDAQTTAAVIHARTSAGGGTFVDVKATPSGALTVETTPADDSFTPTNITSKLREAFEVYDPVNGTTWDEFKATGDLVYVDGNAGAASYLTISKSPWIAGQETDIELDSSKYFNMPTEVAFGLSLSQRTIGQEFSVEVVDTDTPLADIPDVTIASLSWATTTLTIDTVAPHGLVAGKSIGISGCSDPRFNLPAVVVASTPSPTQITITAGPGGNIASQTIANPAGAKGAIFFRERLGRSKNGVAQIFENTTATNASLYIRSEAGDVLPSSTVAGSHSVTVGTTAPVQLVNTAYNYAFVPTTEFRLVVQSDRVQWSDAPVDTTAQATNRLVRSQVCPNPEKLYKLRFRATNNKSLTVPIAQIVSATKTGATTATVVFDRPHGLTTTDFIQAFGTRDQTNFANLTAATAVTAVVDSTTIQVIWGAAVTATTYGGFVNRVQGGVGIQGVSTVVAQSAVLSTLSDGTRQLVLVGNTNWGGLTIGDLTELIGCRDIVTGTTLGLDGPWKVANVATTNLTLVLPFAGQRTLPADFGATNCGGGIVKRTDMRVSFVRVYDFERLRVESVSRPSGDQASGFPTTIQNVPSVAQSGTWTVNVGASQTIGIANGQGVEDAAIAGNAVRTGGRVRTTVPTTFVAGDAADVTMSAGLAQLVQPLALPEATWQTPSTNTGLVNTATPQPLQIAPGAGLRNYIASIDFSSDALTNATELRIREPDIAANSQTIASNTLVTAAVHDLAIGDAVAFTASTVTGTTPGVTYFVLTTPTTSSVTLSATRGGAALAISGTGVTATLHKVLWSTRIPTTGVAPRQVMFPVPLRGSVNKAMQLMTVTASGAGAVYLNAIGYVSV